MEVAGRYGLAVVEDNAHGLFGEYKGRHLGTFGCLAAQSFHETKNITCGEGGALLINAPEYIERAEIIREKGTNRSRFFRGEVDKYTWVDIGSSYLPSDILAAFLYAQLEAREQIQNRRRQIWEYYYAHLQGWAEEWGFDCRLCRRTVNRPTTCSTCSCLHLRSARGSLLPEGAGYPGGIPLPASASLGDGVPIRRQTRGLPRYRRRKRSLAAPSVLQ